MIPRTRSRFRASSEEENSSSRDRVEELSCNEVIRGGGGMTFSEEARRAMAEERVPLVSLADVVGGGTDSSYNHPRIDFQYIAKLVEQILPFSLLLLIVLIRQHFQGMPFFFCLLFCCLIMLLYIVGLDCGVSDVYCVCSTHLLV
jgi:hypothetical protein